MTELCGVFQYNNCLYDNLIEHIQNKCYNSGDISRCKTYIEKDFFLEQTSKFNEVSEFCWNKSNNRVIVFCGKIFNREHLISTLGLSTESNIISDDKIMMCGVELFGEEFLKKVDGKFVFVIYDTDKKECFLARDRVGSIPLYIYNSNGIFAFSSNLKRLLSFSFIPKEIDKDALSQFLQLTYIPAPKSIIKGVNKILPATIVTIDHNGNQKSSSYWDIEINADVLKTADYETCKKKLRQVLIESVENRIKNESSVGAFLSGGFDSTIVVGIMSMLSQSPVNTFTVGFNSKTFDERKLARIVSEQNKTNHTEIVLDFDNVLDDIEYILQNMDEPFADSSLIATYSISKAAKDYVSVILTGDAGDEIFAGYNKYLVSYYGKIYNKIPGFAKEWMIEPAIKCLPSKSSFRRKAEKLISVSEKDDFLQRKQLMCLGFKEPELVQLMRDEYVDPMDFLEKHYRDLKDVDDQTRAQYLDFKIVLEGDMMPKAYKAGLLSGIDSRAPILGNEIVELAYQMPSKFKINRLNRKIILKDAFSDLIPKELYNAPKHGFSVPIYYWLEKNLKDKLYRYSSREFLDEQGLFDYEYIRTIIDQHMAHICNRFSELWSFLVFQDWYVRTFDVSV